jgi:diguanylate cyclase (GGDEF)-like protein
MFTIGSTLLVFFVIASLLISSRATNLSLERFDYVQKVGVLADHLSQHINNETRSESNINRKQWLNDHERLNKILSSVPLLSPEMKTQHNSIVSKNKSMLILFEYLSTFNISQPSQEVKKHLKERLLIQIESIREDSQQLSSIVREDTRQMIKHQTAITIFVLTIGTLGLIWGLFNFNRLFKLSINGMLRGIAEINAGTYRKIKRVQQNNEFSSVIDKFNEMSEQLQKTTISRDSLQKIVDERTKDLVLLSNTDQLTNLANRRALYERGPIEFARAQRYSDILSVLLLDCDFFKHVNDQYGHLTGDNVLKHLSHVCQQQVREIDFIARYGGEEFIIILPHCDEESAIKQAKRIQQALSMNKFITDEKLINITLSIGITSLKECHQSFDDMVNDADKAMYIAKVNGRNRIEVA